MLLNVFNDTPRYLFRSLKLSKGNENTVDSTTSGLSSHHSQEFFSAQASDEHPSTLTGGVIIRVIGVQDSS